MAITPLEPLKQLSSITEKSSITTKNSPTASFEDVLTNAVGKVKDLETDSNQASYDLAVGNTDDLTSVMLAATKAQTAIQLTTQITTRAVNAYKEIMQMNI